ncbi:hypothetical protein THASP1DRAFT_31198 [Thamnocephalis sphaerospora]|uniref:Late embryogenesis abundant protein LEA-2 subgroup domain-containing protein n=1 Tax=Thamnocephalis sphaerospora TaxID=78915 RepID=A0A4P9XM68_9FUNG|nr:hypothetical protein THASP1DRAFT_31198 [Thamnocephalis sphaerospora]|eukprot:RKP06988.1 hypothetical protein THASP1DRAFT_31198 [Thamnocephalis sphaerospora]
MATPSRRAPPPYDATKGEPQGNASSQDGGAPLGRRSSRGAPSSYRSSLQRTQSRTSSQSSVATPRSTPISFVQPAVPLDEDLPLGFYTTLPPATDVSGRDVSAYVPSRPSTLAAHSATPVAHASISPRSPVSLRDYSQIPLPPTPTSSQPSAHPESWHYYHIPADGQTPPIDDSVDDNRPLSHYQRSTLGSAAAADTLYALPAEQTHQRSLAGEDMHNSTSYESPPPVPPRDYRVPIGSPAVISPFEHDRSKPVHRRKCQPCERICPCCVCSLCCCSIVTVVLLALLALLGFFLWPRIPEFSLVSATPITLPNVGLEDLRSGRALSFTSRWNVSVAVDNRNYISWHFDNITGVMLDPSSGRQMGNGTLLDYTLPGRKNTTVALPVDLFYQGQGLLDPVITRIISTCATRGNQLPMRLRVTIVMPVVRWFTKPSVEETISLRCPFG